MKGKIVSRRNFMKLSGTALLSSPFFMSWGTRVFASQTKTDFNQIRFGVIADAHLDVQGQNGMKMSKASLRCIQKTVQDLNQEGVSFVIVAGDLLLDGEKRNAEAIKDELDALKMPYYVVAGNHDYMPLDPDKRREGFDYISIHEFINFFQGHGYNTSGKRYYAQEIVPGFRVIGLDACLPEVKGKWGGVLPQEQLDWLDKQLNSHADALNLIVMHHNAVRWTADEVPGGPKQWFAIDNDQEFRKLMSKHAPAAPVVLSGHRHLGLHFSKINDVYYFALPSVNSHPMRYTIFSITNESISWKTPMVSVHESTHLKAKANLLKATWWRPSHFTERNAYNDAKVIELYENNGMITGDYPL